MHDGVTVRHHRHVGDAVAAAGVGVRAEELEIALLPGLVDLRLAAQLLADVVVLLRPQQEEVVAIHLLRGVGQDAVADALPGDALRRVGARHQGRAIENALLVALGLGVPRAHMVQRPFCGLLCHLREVLGIEHRFILLCIPDALSAVPHAVSAHHRFHVLDAVDARVQLLCPLAVLAVAVG